MAKKLRPDPITKEDLTRFTRSESDFAFELSLIPILRDNKWEVLHGGTYSDPITGLNRQFDLRAHFHHTPHNLSGQRPWFSFSTRLAIECKNLKPNYPLLISSVPRTQAEAKLALLLSKGGTVVAAGTAPCVASRYWPNQPVGKSTDQVGIHEQGGFIRGDSEVYDKWSQAIASSADLLRASAMTKPNAQADVCINTILPVLVVPDGTLWECRYMDGLMVKEPEPVEHVEFYIDKVWSVSWLSFAISHLEILTVTGFKRWIQEVGYIDANSAFGMQCLELARETSVWQAL